LIHSTAAAAEGVERGPGLAHALIFEPSLATNAGLAVSEIEKTAGELERAAGEIERGGGDVEEVLAEIRKGHGLLHELVYDEDKAHLVRDLGDTARILRQLAVETQQGKGTIGALLKDPTAYEDLIGILGNLRRNALLKALVRYTIVKDGLERPGRVDGKPDPVVPTGRSNASTATP
jgi:phospholipid/cholesterol/gamma-HCH transport system substrate-binding protein